LGIRRLQLLKAREVVVTGIGLLLPNCDDPDAFWLHLKSGTSQLAVLPDPSDPAQMVVAGRMGRSDADRHLAEVPEQHLQYYSREVRFYLASVLLARNDAGLKNGRVSGKRTGVYDGSSRGAVEFWDQRVRMESERPARDLYCRKDILNAINGQTVGIAAALFGTTGPALALGGSCAAGLIAVAQACRDIEADRADVAFASGHDFALTPGLFAAYGEAGLLRRTPDTSNGEGLLAFSEGAVTLVLEEREFALARGARILARITGHGYCNEGKNPFTVDPTGQSQAELIGSVIRSAGVEVGDVDLVVGHGNGLRDSDMAEKRYMRILFGDQADSTPLISTKLVFGHTLGASGLVNLAACALMLHHGYVLPSNGTGTFPTGKSGSAGRHDPDVSKGVAFTCGMGGLISACLLEREEPTQQ